MQPDESGSDSREPTPLTTSCSIGSVLIAWQISAGDARRRVVRCAKRDSAGDARGLHSVGGMSIATRRHQTAAE
jgi:hypothetical protein